MAIVTLLNQKGGVGKTTVTLGLASAAQAAGRSVLVVDLDPQANASWALGVDPTDAEGRLVGALDADAPGGAAGALQPSAWGSGVRVLPAAPDLAAWRPAGSEKAQTGRLARALRRVPLPDELVLLDCPPGAGTLTVNALAASDLAVIVVEPAVFSNNLVESVADLIDDVWQRFNPALDLAGVIVNRVPAVSAEAERRAEELGRIVGRRSIWKPPLPLRVVFTQAAGERRPIHSYGGRARDVIEALDALYAKLRRAEQRAAQRAAGT
jgi:chromosome partitioning protein